MPKYFFKTKSDGQIQGPFTGIQIKELVLKGKLKHNYLVSQDQNKWFLAAKIKGLNFVKEKKKKEESQNRRAEDMSTDVGGYVKQAQKVDDEKKAQPQKKKERQQASNCPNCGITFSTETFDECPKCGIIFNKFKDNRSIPSDIERSEQSLSHKSIPQKYSYLDKEEIVRDFPLKKILRLQIYFFLTFLLITFLNFKSSIPELESENLYLTNSETIFLNLTFSLVWLVITYIPFEDFYKLCMKFILPIFWEKKNFQLARNKSELLNDIELQCIKKLKNRNAWLLLDILIYLTLSTMIISAIAVKYSNALKILLVGFAFVSIGLMTFKWRNINSIFEDSKLGKLFLNDKKVLEKLGDQFSLYSVYQLVSNSSIKLNPTILIDLLVNDKNIDVGNILPTLKRIRSQSDLEYISKNGKHYEVRRDAVRLLTDERVLADIVINDENNKVRKEAFYRLISNGKDKSIINKIIKKYSDNDIITESVGKISDQKILKELFLNSDSKDVKLAVIKKIEDQIVLNDIVQNSKESNDIREAAAERITDQDILTEIAKNDKDKNIRKLVIQKLTDQSVLGEIVESEKDVDVRETAIQEIKDQDILGEFAKSSSSEDQQISILAQLTNQDILKDLVNTANNKKVKIAAINKIYEQSFLTGIIQNDEDEDCQSAALKMLEDFSNLNKIAEEHHNAETRKIAKLRINEVLKKKKEEGYIECKKCGKFSEEGWECINCNHVYCESCVGESKSMSSISHKQLPRLGTVVYYDLTQPDKGPSCLKCRNELMKRRRWPKAYVKTYVNSIIDSTATKSFKKNDDLIKLAGREKGAFLDRLYRHLSQMKIVNVNAWYNSVGKQVGPRLPFSVIDEFFDSQEAVIERFLDRNDRLNYKNLHGISFNEDCCIVEFESNLKLFSLLRVHNNQYYWWNIWQR